MRGSWQIPALISTPKPKSALICREFTSENQLPPLLPIPCMEKAVGKNSEWRARTYGRLTKPGSKIFPSPRLQFVLALNERALAYVK